jgi:uncharacterized protein YjbI with pentapeptide repeats
MPADRHPEAPRLPAGLPRLRLERPIGDGDAFTGAEIPGASAVDLRVAALELAEVVLREPDLTGAVLTDAVARDTVIDNPNLANATLRGGTLTRVAVNGGRLTGLQVTETEIRDGVWSGCGADLATFRHARLAHVTFQDCSLRESDFTGVRAERVRFLDCDLRGAGFHHAEFTCSELRRCRLDDIEGVEGLRGTSMELGELVSLAPLLARALGVGVLPHSADASRGSRG